MLLYLFKKIEINNQSQINSIHLKTQSHFKKLNQFLKKSLIKNHRSRGHNLTIIKVFVRQKRMKIKFSDVVRFYTSVFNGSSKTDHCNHSSMSVIRICFATSVFKSVNKWLQCIRLVTTHSFESV